MSRMVFMVGEILTVPCFEKPSSIGGIHGGIGGRDSHSAMLRQAVKYWWDSWWDWSARFSQCHASTSRQVLVGFMVGLVGEILTVPCFDKPSSIGGIHGGIGRRDSHSAMLRQAVKYWWDSWWDWSARFSQCHASTSRQVLVGFMVGLVGEILTVPCF